MNSVVGAFLGKKLRLLFVFLYKTLLISLSNILILIKSDSRKAIVVISVFVCIILGIFALYPEIRKSINRRNLMHYYKMESLINRSDKMDISIIKSDILDKCSGILKINNAIKVAKKIQSSRINDAIEILKYARLTNNTHNINDILSMNILAMEINNNLLDRNLGDVKKISYSQNRLSILAMELLAENDLSRGLIGDFYTKINTIQQSGKIKTPYMQHRINELSFIGYNNKHVK